MNRTSARLLGFVVTCVVALGVMAAPASATPPKPSAQPTLLTKPANPTGSTSATFTWSSAVASQIYTCALDGAKATSCSSGQTYNSLLPNRQHTFTLRAKNPPPGKWRTATVSYSWTIDTIGPQAPTVTQVPTPTKNTSATVSFTDADPSAVAYACALDDNDPTHAVTCTPPYVVAGPLAEGPHTAYVYALDSLGNRSSAGTTTWTVDTTAPASPVFSQQPTSPTVATSATLAWSDADATGFVCSLDGAAYATCSSPTTLGVAPSSPLTGGPHSFSVQGTDAVGNVGPAVSASWFIDLDAPPAPDILTGPASSTDQSSATFEFSDQDATATFLCSLDSATYAACSSPLNLPSLADGQHSLQIEAQDQVGNVSSATPYVWTVDTSGAGTVVLSPPAFLSGPPARSNDAHPAFQWASLDDTTTGFVCGLDGGPFSACSGPDVNGNGDFTVPGAVTLTEGLHVLAVKATSGASSSPASTWSWTYDKTAPPVPVFSTTPPAITNSTTAVFSFASEMNAQFTCALDSGATVLCASPVTFNDLAPGGHTFLVTATDAAGNSSAAPSYAWTIDQSAPQGPAVTGPTGYVGSALADITWTDTDPSVTSTTCTLDGAAYAPNGQPCASPVHLTSLSDGQHLFAVTVSNATAHTAESDVTWTVDTAPPTLQVTGAPGGSVNATTAAPAVSQTDLNPGAIVCSLSRGAVVVSATCGPYSDLADGVYTLRVDTTDLAGNAADQVTRGWTVDTAPPTATIHAPSTLTTPVTATFAEVVHGVTGSAGALTLSGTATVVPTVTTCLAGATTVPCTGPFTALRLAAKFGLVPGQHYTVTLPASLTQDAAGNPSTAATSSFRGQRVVQENSVGVRATWARVGTTSAYGGSYAREHLAGATASWSFSGTRVVWATVMGPAQGKARVIIDGKVRATVNNYAAATHYRVLRAYSGLAAGRHVITLRVLGLKGSTRGTGTFVSVDAFTVGKTLTASPTLRSTFRGLASSRYLAGHASVSDVRSATVSMVFRGTGVTWYTITGRAQGKAALYIDGVLKRTVDNYAALTHYAVARSITGLPDRLHTLRIVVLGTQRVGGKGTSVTFDRFAVA